MEGFIQFLRYNAYANLDVSGHKTDLHGWMCDNFESVFSKECSLLDSDSDSDKDVKHNNPILIIEVGSWKGLSTNTMANILKKNGCVNATIIAIDTWLGAPEFWTPNGLHDPTRGMSFNMVNGYPTVFYTFTKNVKSLGNHDIIVPFPISSGQAPDVLKVYNCQADAIYIDAAHEYEPVKADLNAYWPLLKPGGVMFGDDYNDYWVGLTRAVDEFTAQHKLELHVEGIVWWVRKSLS